MAKLIGPFGGPGGNTWDDGSIYTGVRTIVLSFNSYGIGSFTVTYDKSGNPVQGPPHPSGDQTYPTAPIELQFPSEVITEVKGYYGVVSGATTQTPVIRSLTFSTNNGHTYGPYGAEEGTPFTYNIQTGHIAGFRGRTSSDYLDAIGFYVSPSP